METTENKTLLDAGASLAGPSMIGNSDIPFVVIPDGYTVKDLEYLLPAPTRKRSAVQMHDADSFCSYFDTHRTRDANIYADIDNGSERFVVLAVFDDNGGDFAGWRDHTCTLVRRPSVEWKRWNSKCRANMGQAEFATFLEENLVDVVNAEGMPTGSEILQMALAFERTADKRLKSKVNLQSGGVRFEYVDDDNAETRTSMQVFSRFCIGIPVFDGATVAYQIEARLKYRDNSGKLSFWYELIRPDRAFKQAVTEELESISLKAVRTILRGTIGPAAVK